MRKYIKPGPHQQLDIGGKGRAAPQISDGKGTDHISAAGKIERLKENREIERLAMATLGDWDND